MNRNILSLIVLLVLASGCDAQLVVAGNLIVAIVPCGLLLLTVNLSKPQ